MITQISKKEMSISQIVQNIFPECKFLNEAVIMYMYSSLLRDNNYHWPNITMYTYQ